MSYPKGIYRLPSPLSRNFKDVIDKKYLIKLGQAEQEWVVHLLVELAEHFDNWVGVDLQILYITKELSESLKITAHFIITMREDTMSIVNDLERKGLISVQIESEKIIIFPTEKLITALQAVK